MSELKTFPLHIRAPTLHQTYFMTFYCHEPIEIILRHKFKITKN